MSRSHSQCRKTGAQFLLGSLTPGDRLSNPWLLRKEPLVHRNRLMVSIPAQQFRWAPRPLSCVLRAVEFLQVAKRLCARARRQHTASPVRVSSSRNLVSSPYAASANTGAAVTPSASAWRICPRAITGLVLNEISSGTPAFLRRFWSWAQISGKYKRHAMEDWHARWLSTNLPPHGNFPASRLSAVLVGHSDGVRSFLGETGVVHDPSYHRSVALHGG